MPEGKNPEPIIKFNKDFSSLSPLNLDKLRQPQIQLDRVIENLGRLSNEEQLGVEKWRALFDVQGITPPKCKAYLFMRKPT